MAATKSGGREDVDSRIRPGVARVLSVRSILLALVLLPANAYFVVQLEIVRYQSWPSILSLSMNSLFVLLLLALASRLLRGRLRRFALTPAELITVYVTLSLGTVLAGQDQFQVLVFTITHPASPAAQQRAWSAGLVGALPSWLIVTDSGALSGFFRGNSSLFDENRLNAWLVPGLAWTGFALALFWVMVCTNSVLRKQWVDRERLTFPVVQVPVAVASSPGTLTSRTLWLGFGVASVIALVNGLNALSPGLPSLPVRVLSLPAPVERPWSALGGVSGSVYPFAVGLGMLMPADLAFSCWFFLWFQKLQAVACTAAGLDGIVTEFPFIHQQAAGALIGISLFALWSERRHLTAVVRRALGLPSDADDTEEPLSYRQALAGGALGVGAMTVFCSAAGLSVWVTLTFLALYLAIAVGVTRLRAELGAPVHDVYYMGPETFMIDAVGSAVLGRRNLGVLSLLYWLRRQYGGHPMPVQLESLKMADRVGMGQRRMVGVLMIAALGGTLAAFVVIVAAMYHLGAKSARVHDVSGFFGGEAFTALESQLTGGAPASPLRLAAAVLGAVFAFVLLSIRLVLPKWPFHPLGFALAGSWYMQTAVWLSIFVAWLVKVLLLRYGGHRAYVRALPFFFGLILGDCVWGMLWLIYGVWSDRPTYSVWF